jgi:hypothetical protein
MDSPLRIEVQLIVPSNGDSAPRSCWLNRTGLGIGFAPLRSRPGFKPMPFWIVLAESPKT